VILKGNEKWRRIILWTRLLPEGKSSMIQNISEKQVAIVIVT
jgi:hypothetical protein